MGKHFDGSMVGATDTGDDVGNKGLPVCTPFKGLVVVSGDIGIVEILLIVGEVIGFSDVLPDGNSFEITSTWITGANIIGDNADDDGRSVGNLFEGFIF